jgi:hypothetical protein
METKKLSERNFTAANIFPGLSNGLHDKSKKVNF